MKLPNIVDYIFFRTEAGVYEIHALWRFNLISLLSIFVMSYLRVVNQFENCGSEPA